VLPGSPRYWLDLGLCLVFAADYAYRILVRAAARGCAGAASSRGTAGQGMQLQWGCAACVLRQGCRLQQDVCHAAALACVGTHVRSCGACLPGLFWCRRDCPELCRVSAHMTMLSRQLLLSQCFTLINLLLFPQPACCLVPLLLRIDPVLHRCSPTLVHSTNHRPAHTILWWLCSAP
jgi:hypothetical protein